MADRGRDLKVAILSDVSKFDADDPARQLDDLADAARDAGTDLARLERDAKDAGTSVERMGADAKDAGTDLARLEDDAKDVADKVEASFRQIGDASRKAGDDTKTGMDDAESGLADVRSEAGETAREVGASFTGSFDDIVDGFQEVAAQGLASLGAIGAGAGLALAAGIGMWRSAMEAAEERVAGLVERLRDLQQGTSTADESFRDFLDSLDGEQLDALANDAKTLGVSVQTLARAWAGEADAVAQVAPKVAAYQSALERANSTQGAAGLQLADLLGKTVGLSEGTSDLADDVDSAESRLATYNTALGDSAAAAEDMAEATDAISGSLQEFGGAADAYTTALQEKAAAEDASVENTRVTTAEFLAQLREQVTAQTSWADNMAALARRGVDDGVLAELARMGPEGAPLVAQLVTASDAELADLAGLMQQRAATATDRVVGQIRAGTPAAATAAAEYARGAAAGFSGQEQSWTAAAARLTAAAQAELDRRGPLKIRLAYENPGSPPVYRQGDRYLQ